MFGNSYRNNNKEIICVSHINHRKNQFNGQSFEQILELNLRSNIKLSDHSPQTKRPNLLMRSPIFVFPYEC